MEGVGRYIWRDFSGTLERDPFVVIVVLVCGDAFRRFDVKFPRERRTGPEAQRTLFERRLGAPFAWPAKPNQWFCRECNRRKKNIPSTETTAGCAPGRFLVASGDRRREHPTGPGHPPGTAALQRYPLCSLSRPAGGAVDLDFHPPTRRTEPTLHQAQTNVRVEDDRREDDKAPT